MPGPIGGPGPLWKRAIWVFIAACITVAVYNAYIGPDPSNAYDRLHHKSKDVRDFAEKLGSDIDKQITKQQRKNDANRNTTKNPSKGNGKNNDGKGNGGKNNSNNR